MMNTVGKSLVVLSTGVSLLLLGFALAIFTNQVDWGWKEPRKFLDERVPSEIDKRLVAVDQTLQTTQAARNRLADAEKRRAGLEPVWPANSLWYAAELNKVLADANPIAVQTVKTANGQVVTDPAQPGRPVLEGKVTYKDSLGQETEVNKSLLQYLADIKQVQQDNAKLNQDIIDLVKEQEAVTRSLNGQVDQASGKVLRPGLYQLLDQEALFHRQLKREIADVRPLWVQKLVDAQFMLSRQSQLEARLQELRDRLTARGPVK